MHNSTTYQLVAEGISATKLQRFDGLIHEAIRYTRWVSGVPLLVIRSLIEIMPESDLYKHTDREIWKQIEIAMFHGFLIHSSDSEKITNAAKTVLSCLNGGIFLPTKSVDTADEMVHKESPQEPLGNGSYRGLDA